MRTIAFLGFLLSALATPLIAADIRWKLETLKPGDYTSIDQSKAGLIHHVFRGKVGRYYVIDSYRGPSPSGTPVFSTYLDKDGNYAKWVRPDGTRVEFLPHDCTRTLGRCQYTIVESDGKREVRLRITAATRKGYKYDEYDSNGRRLFGGKSELDARGTAGNGKVDSNQGTQRYRLVKQFYQ
jgi:hypothetical protein